MTATATAGLSTVRSMRRLLAVTSIALLTVAACSSDDNRAQTKPKSTSSTTTSTTAPSPTTTAVPNPHNARFTLEPIAAVDSPTAIAIRNDDATIYVTEQVGRVRAIRDDQLVETPVLDIRDSIASGGERGLLGIAFSPDGTTMYTDYTNRNGDTRIEAFPMRADGTADVAARRVILGITQPQPNHNGGNIVTGPDGMLWIGTGDGGAAGDTGSGHAPQGNGQSLDTLLGKMLRINPTPAGPEPYTIPADNPYARGGGRPEIWAYGLRNPWRFSFDAGDGALVIGDVGQNAYEEINWVAAGTPSPLNFGWPKREGKHKFRSDDASGTVAPILDYPHDGRCSISGGYVYRGTKIHDLVGTYLYADYCDGKIRGTDVGPAASGNDIDFGITAQSISGFGQDSNHELLVMAQGDGSIGSIATGEGIFRITPA